MRISDGSSDVCSSDLGRGMSGMIDLGRGSLVDRAVDAVRDYIRIHDLKVGDTLPGEGSFATELGVSRPVMREAFGAPTALRLVDVGNVRKPHVAAFDGSVMARSAVRRVGDKCGHTLRPRW